MYDSKINLNPSKKYEWSSETWFILHFNLNSVTFKFEMTGLDDAEVAQQQP